MREFVVVYEQGETNWGAIVPDLPGCVSIGNTRAEAEANVREAIALYLEVLRERGEPAPEPTLTYGTVTVPA